MVRFIWNKDKTACVRAKKIRTIILVPMDSGRCKVSARFNSAATFSLGEFDSAEEARTFIFNGLN